MKFKVEDLDLASGDVLVVVLNQKDAEKLDLKPEDRVKIRKNHHEAIAVIDISESDKTVKEGRIGLFEEVLDKLKAKHNDIVELQLTAKPESVGFIRAKLHGQELDYHQTYRIVEDIVNDRLTAVEKTYFVSACFTEGMTIKEIVHLTKAMVNTGTQLKFRGRVFDKHCIGGVAGNRTTMLIVPICVAAGLKMPKTSSRAITSPAGTADTMEVLCNVELNARKMKEVVDKVGGCIVWGGAFNLAPADDKIIQVENPLSIDAEGQLLASVMAKKKSVGSNHVLIDIPKGQSAKVKTQQEALHLKEMFEIIAKEMEMEVKVIITEGNQPIGNGIGPYLEAKDVMAVLENEPGAPADLKEKALMMAGELLEMNGTRNGYNKAKEVLEKGLALKKMKEIINAQGKQKIEYGLPKNQWVVRAEKHGLINEIDNVGICKVARLAGAPVDKEAGIYLHKKAGQRVKKGEALYTIYAKSDFKLELAKKLAKELQPYSI